MTLIDLEGCLCVAFSVWFSIQLCSSWQDFNWHSTLHCASWSWLYSWLEYLFVI